MPRNFKSILDVAASLAMILAAGAMTWVSFRNSPDSGPGPIKKTTTALPANPVYFEGAPRIGKKTAALAIVEFSDFQCPYCIRFSREVLPSLQQKYITTGIVQMAFRHLPLSRIHPLAEKAAIAAQCAAKVGKFWEMHDRLFLESPRLEEEVLRGYAESIGIPGQEFDHCMSGYGRDQIVTDLADAKTLGLSGTPSFLIGTMRADGGLKVTNVLKGAASLDAFTEAIKPLTGSSAGRSEH